HVDDAHAPFADDLQQFVGADQTAGTFDVILSHGFVTTAPWRMALKEAAQPVLLGVESRNPLLERCVIPAGSVQERRSLVRGPLHSLGEDFPLVHGAHLVRRRESSQNNAKSACRDCKKKCTNRQTAAIWSILYPNRCGGIQSSGWSSMTKSASVFTSP